MASRAGAEAESAESARRQSSNDVGQLLPPALQPRRRSFNPSSPIEPSISQLPNKEPSSAGTVPPPPPPDHRYPSSKTDHYSTESVLRRVRQIISRRRKQTSQYQTALGNGCGMRRRQKKTRTRKCRAERWPVQLKANQSRSAGR